MSSTAIIICLIGIALAIALNYKFGVNMGVTGLAIAWIAGCIVMGLKVKDVVALWPNSVVFQLMSITLFFGFAVVNGTMQAIADHLLYKVRNQTWLIAFAIFFIGFILGALGCPPPAANAICAVIGFSVGLSAGLHPIIIAWGVCMGANLGCCLPWASQGSVVNNTIASNGYEAESYGMTLEFLLAYFVVTFVILIILYVVFKGHKLGEVVVKEPEPFSPVHKKSLVMIFIVVGLVIVPSLLKLFIQAEWLDTLSRCADIQMLGMVGFVICSLMKLADEKAVIRSVHCAHLRHHRFPLPAGRLPQLLLRRHQHRIPHARSPGGGPRLQYRHQARHHVHRDPAGRLLHRHLPLLHRRRHPHVQLLG